MKIYNQKLFSNFYTDGSNNYATSVAKKISIIKNAKTKTPLLICGKVGRGKTHLAAAILNRIKKKDKNAKVGIFEAEKIYYNYNVAKQNKKNFEFTGNNKKFTAIVFDGIQVFEDDPKMQTIFYEILKKTIKNGTQIILTTTIPVSKINFENELLLKFLNSSIPLKVKRPSKKIRLKVIKSMLSESKVQVKKKLVRKIAAINFDNSRVLAGFCISLIYQQKYKNDKISNYSIILLQDKFKNIKHPLL